MKRLALVCAFVMLAGGGASGALRIPELAVIHGSQGVATLAWVDPHTLRVVPRGLLARGRAAWPMARSPGGRYLLTVGAASTATHLAIVDSKLRRTIGSLELVGVNGVHAAWPERSRIVAVTMRNGSADERLVLSPHPLRVAKRAPVSGTIVAARSAGSSLVLLLAPPERIGPLRVVRLAADGETTTLALDGVTGGWQGRNTTEGYVSKQAGAALAVEPAGRRAVVVGLTRYAVVDLAARRAAVHALSGRRLQKRIEGWHRQAEWAGNGRVAVAGVDYTPDGAAPSGLQLVALRDGAVRTLDATASSVVRRGVLLIGSGRGLSAFRLDGTPRYRVADESIGDVMVGRSYLYVNDSRDRTRFRLIDPADGRIAGRARTERPTTVTALP